MEMKSGSDKWVGWDDYLVGENTLLKKYIDDTFDNKELLNKLY